MKHRAMERKIKMAKDYSKNWPRASDVSRRGNLVYHQYPVDSSRTQGWWDDVAFRFGSQLVLVIWTHPRMDYQDTCENLAYDNVVHLKPQADDHNWLNDATKIHKFVGKNKKRKRVVAYRLKSSTLLDQNREWYKVWDKEKLRVSASGEIEIKPYIKITQGHRHRMVRVCLPLEVIDQTSLEDMADVVRDILNGKSTIEGLFPGYTYSSSNWLAEGNSAVVFDE